MNYYLLRHIATHLAQYKTIESIRRVEDNLLEVVFDRTGYYYFDMTKGGSHVFKKSPSNKSKEFLAPFDSILHKRFNNAKIRSIEVLGNDRILQIEVDSRLNAYKSESTKIIFEFTSRITNVMVVNDVNIILEALRHVDEEKSIRLIRPQTPYAPPPATTFVHKPFDEIIVDMGLYLEAIYQRKEHIKLDATKRMLIAKANTKIANLAHELSRLEKQEELTALSQHSTLMANAILANLDIANIHLKTQKLKDYESNVCEVSYPPLAKSPTGAARMLFDRAKRLLNKAQNIHLEEQSLGSKINFYTTMVELIDKSQSLDALSPLIPPTTAKTKTKAKEYCYTFFHNGYKIMLGRNEKENIYLLETAKASDMWLHIKDYPSAHVIIKTDKQTLPQAIIDEAARLCVEFSSVKRGDYLVDYTKRRDVKITKGADVNYFNYKTVKIRK